MIEDRAGNLWFGHPDPAGGGVTRYDGKSFTPFTEKEGLCSNNVYCLMQDKTGDIWVGTLNAGVCRYDGKVFTYYSERATKKP